MCDNIKPATEQDKQTTIAYKTFRNNNGKPEYEYWINNGKVSPYPKQWNTAKNPSLRSDHSSSFNKDIADNGFCAFKTIEGAKSWSDWTNDFIATIEIKQVTATATMMSSQYPIVIFKKFRITQIMENKKCP